jgi:hypothetical protein
MMAKAMSDVTIIAPSAIPTPRAGRAATVESGRWITRLAILFITLLLIVPVGLVALGSGAGLIALPYEMFELVQRVPVLFPAHMISGALALLLAPIVVMTRRRAKFHRPLGRLLGVFVVIGGLTALPIAILSHSTPWARAGFFVQGLVWLYLLGSAYIAIRNGDVRRHAHLMIAMVAVTTGAVWFRLITGTAIALQVPFEPVYAASAWIGWMLPLALVLAKPRVVAGLLSR